MIFLILLLICQLVFFEVRCASMGASKNIATLLYRRSQKVLPEAYKKKMSAVIENRLSRVLASHAEGSLEEGQERLTEEDIAKLRNAVDSEGVLNLCGSPKEFFLRVFHIEPEIPLSVRRIRLDHEDIGIFLPFFQNLIGINFYLYDERRGVQSEEWIYLSAIQELRFSGLFMHPCRKIPAWVRDLKRLRSLDINWNVNLDIDDDFEFPPNLEELTIAACNLKKIPKALSRLERLRSLDLSDNLNLDIDDDFEFPPNLGELRINCCGLEKIPRSVSRLEKLKNLDISCNQKILISDDFEFPPNLEKLVLRFCKLRKIPRSLSTHPCLTHIDFSMNGKIDMSDNFGFPANLETLDFSGCLLEHIPAWMHTLKDPRALDLLARSNLVVDAERGRTAGALWGI